MSVRWVLLVLMVACIWGVIHDVRRLMR